MKSTHARRDPTIVDPEARALRNARTDDGLFPIAANVTLFATLLDTRRKEAATLVALPSFVSLALVAAVVALFGGSIMALRP